MDSKIILGLDNELLIYIIITESKMITLGCKITLVSGEYMKNALFLMLFFIAILSNQCVLAEEISSEFGAIEFERSCSSCHGFDGKGNGFLSRDLNIKPADLTQISKKNSGHFPFSEVYRTIDGSKRVGMHGSREMPVWGEEYRKEAEKHDLVKGVYTRGVILELMLHIYSIQEE